MASLSHPNSKIDLLISILFTGLCIAAHNEVTLTFPFALIVFNQCISVESDIPYKIDMTELAARCNILQHNNNQNSY